MSNLVAAGAPAHQVAACQKQQDKLGKYLEVSAEVLSASDDEFFHLRVIQRPERTH